MAIFQCPTGLIPVIIQGTVRGKIKMGRQMNTGQKPSKNGLDIHYTARDRQEWKHIIRSIEEVPHDQTRLWDMRR